MTAALQPPPEPLRVVLIDDTPDIRLLIRMALERHGQFAVVGEASDGRAGVETVVRERPDVALVDLAMPVMDGLEVLARIRRDAPRTKAIVLSGFDSRLMSERAVAAGAIAYIQKGASTKRVVSAVCSALGLAEVVAVARAVGSEEVLPTPAPAAELDRVHEALAGAAHELRGPATVLLAMTELLSTERDRLDAGTFNRMIDAIARQAQVLDRVTSDLLTSTQSQRGVLTVDVERVQLRPLVDGAALGLGARGQVRVDCDPDIWVDADATRVQQMLGNLVSNALKYGAAPIAIEARAGAELATVRVVDHGAGVPVEFRDRLFGQFSRAEGARVNGMGLGLFVVRSLTEAQGGTAWYEPIPERGSAFCFSLPLAAGEPTGQEAPVVSLGVRAGS